MQANQASIEIEEMEPLKILLCSRVLCFPETSMGPVGQTLIMTETWIYTRLSDHLMQAKQTIFIEMMVRPGFSLKSQNQVECQTQPDVAGQQFGLIMT